VSPARGRRSLGDLARLVVNFSGPGGHPTRAAVAVTEAREELLRRVWARVAPVLEANPIPDGILPDGTRVFFKTTKERPS